MKKMFLLLALFLTGCAQQLKYNAGDLVKLKSGSGYMVVEYNCYDDGRVWVDWVDKEGRPHNAGYQQTQVIKVEK